MANPQVVVDFIADTSKLNAGFSQAGQGAQGFGGKIKGLAKAGVVAAGAAGLAALTGTLKVGIDELTEASKVAAQTNAVIKSTGGAAGVSAKQVSELAGALMEKTGVDDEAIQSGENLLLTFTRVQNQAGKGNDIFNQATKTMLDMSVALGQDMKTSAIQLGKALNDPVKGITALTRVGVTFSDAQKEQIKRMQESGDTMGAQKVILAELNKEFGGSAEAAGKTLPGQINILKESFANLAGTLVSVLAPALTTVTKFLVENPGLAKALVIGVLALAAAFVTLNVALAISTALSAPYLGIILAVAAGVAALIVVAVLLARNWDVVTGVLTAGFDAIKSAASSVFDWLRANWPLLLGILTGPVGLAVAMVIRHWDTIRSATNSAWNAVSNATSRAWNSVQSAVSSVVGAVVGAVSGAWNTVRSVTSSVWGGVEDKVTGVVSSVRSALSAFATWVSGFAHGVLTTAVNAVANVFDKIGDGAQAAVHTVRTAMNSVVGAIESIIGKVRSAADSVANAIKAPINAVINGWNRLSFTIPKVEIPKLKIGKKTFGGGGFGGKTIGFPNITPLQAGGIVTSPTLALLGEAGPEAVMPLTDLPAPNVEVRVFIGDTELKGMVRTEVVDANTGLARSLLAGRA